jgi:hypothetical protein
MLSPFPLLIWKGKKKKRKKKNTQEKEIHFAKEFYHQIILNKVIKLGFLFYPSSTKKG